jgi:hypothetical protein
MKEAHDLAEVGANIDHFTDQATIRIKNAHIIFNPLVEAFIDLDVIFFRVHGVQGHLCIAIEITSIVP